eukprot:2632977-Pleurochrysis_carterae.AAC.1
MGESVPESRVFSSSSVLTPSHLSSSVSAMVPLSLLSNSVSRDSRFMSRICGGSVPDKNVVSISRSKMSSSWPKEGGTVPETKEESRSSS